jgi:DNA-binding NarL/FixJ family response regulator
MDRKGGGTPRVVIADGHGLFRQGLRELLEEQGISVVGEAETGHDAVALVAHASPDVLVLELNLPLLSGLEVIGRLHEEAPGVRAVVLTNAAGERDVADSVLAGAEGYLLKEASAEEIAAGVRAVARGESALCPLAARRVVTRLRTSARPHHPSANGVELSEREVEVLQLLARGRENHEIAEELVISPRTVGNHISSILTKLELNNRIQAAVYAVRRGLA